MTYQKPIVTVTRKLPDLIETRLMELYECHLNLDDVPFSSEQLIHALQNSDILIPTVTDRLDRNLLTQALNVDKHGDGEGVNRLRLIASFGTGYDHIDVKTATQCGVQITNTPDVLTEDTADMTMALILAVPRRIVEGEALARSGKWQGWGPTTMLGHRIWGKRLGIIGMGRIGQAVAKRAVGFGLSVHYHNRNRLNQEAEQSLNATYWTSLDQMIAHMDIISVNCPHTPATYHLLNARRFSLMKPHVFIVNTARGEVIDEAALIKALANQNIAGAGLDVFEHEPAINPKLMALKNVVLLPHMGSATIEGRLQMGEKVIYNIRSFMDGHTPPDLITDTQF